RPAARELTTLRAAPGRPATRGTVDAESSCTDTAQIARVRMIRTALQPKWLAALLVAIAFAVACGFLGNWQLEEARAEGRAEAIERAAAMPVAAITEVMQPQSAFPAGASTRPVTATGVYAPEHQVL